MRAMTILRFGIFEVDSASGELRKRGSRLRLSEQPLRLLLALLDQPGQIVTREQLRQRLWPDGTVVGFDPAINKAVSELRGVLGDSAEMPRFIETHSKRGYRFVAAVEHDTHAPLTGPAERVHSDADMACLTGQYLWNRRTVRDLYSSTGWFEHALAMDRGCAPAHAGLANTNVLLGIWGLKPPDVAFGAARRGAQRSLALNPNLADAHTALADVLKDYEWDWSEAERRYQHALRLRPGYATAHQWYAQLLVILGRYQEGASQIELARRADPISPAINAFLPFIYLAGRDYPRALGEAQRAVALEPHAPIAHFHLGRALLFSHRPERAVEVLDHALALAESASMWEAELIF